MDLWGRGGMLKLLVLLLMVVELSALSQLRVPVLRLPVHVVGEVGDGRVALVDGVAILVHTVGLVNAVMLVKVVVLSSSTVIETGVGKAVLANVAVLAIVMSREIRFRKLGCCWDRRRSDGLNGRLEGRLEMIPVTRDG